MVDATLVTIHGFWSSPATWQRLTAVWQADEQLAGLRVHPFGYPSPKWKPLRLSGRRIPGYDDIAQLFVTEYRDVLADDADLAIVTHSQGGLILQRFLEWMLHEGHGRELARIRSVVMLACPNLGSQYLETLRRHFGFDRHAQAGNLGVLNDKIMDTQRFVLSHVVNAAGVDDHQCLIPVHVYAGASDAIVPAASAQAAFPGALVLNGDHSSILDPAALGNNTAVAVKRRLLADLAARRADAAPARSAPATDRPAPASKYTVHIENSRGVTIGDHATSTNYFGVTGPAAGSQSAAREPGEDEDRD